MRLTDYADACPKQFKENYQPAGLRTIADGLRSKNLEQTLAILRTLDNISSPTKLKQMYAYQRESKQQYDAIASEVKREFWNGDLDPV